MPLNVTFLTGSNGITRSACIAADTRGDNPVLRWETPVVYGTQLKMTLVNLQELPLSPSRYRLVTLRAKRSPASLLTADHVKVTVEMDAGDRTYFAGCLCFFADATGKHFVAPVEYGATAHGGTPAASWVPLSAMANTLIYQPLAQAVTHISTYLRPACSLKDRGRRCSIA